MLRCPVCKKTDMAVLELHDVEIDYCFDCAGIWLDAGELELLLDSAEKKDEILASLKDADDKKIKEKKRPCPICRNPMKKVVADLGETQVLIDECINGHGVWFDKGELYEIISCSTENKDNPVLTFLRDMFCCETCNEEDKK